jgi:tellurite resistance protein TehA-like permease
MNPELKKFLQKPVAGTALTVAAGISFFFNLMLLPLVGRAGSSSPNADKNQLAFLGVLGLTFALAALATWAKMLRRSGDKSPLPYWSLALCAICAALFVLLMTGLLAV